MEFWGVEVKAGKPLKVTPELGKVIHISQAALGEVKEKGNGLIPLRLNIDDQKHVLGSLSTETIPQVSFDLVFEKEFELSHGWKNGSVYFCGYSAEAPLEDDSEFGDEDDEEEDEDDLEIVPTLVAANGKKKVESPANKGKAGKTKVAIEKAKKVESDDSSDDEDDDDSDEDMLGSDDEDDSEDEKTPTPKKPVSAKKRANDSATKTPVQAKKAKTETPQKTDGKKGHVATPHPAKKADKSSAAKAAQSPKSDSKVVCKSCSKTFNSEKGLESHSKAKHAEK